MGNNGEEPARRQHGHKASLHLCQTIAMNAFRPPDIQIARLADFSAARSWIAVHD
jgi:hypothetical protein